MTISGKPAMGVVRVVACVALCLAAAGCNSGGERPSAEESRNKSALTAAKDGRKSRVDTLLGEGVNVNVADSNADTMLHLASGGGHDGLVKDLIGKGAAVSAQNAAGDTPLHLAAKHAHPKCIQALLAAGASKSARNKEGKTPADVADLKVKGLVTP